MKKLRLWWYKRRLRKVYLKRQEILSNSNCGISILRHLSSDFAKLDSEVDRLFGLCKKLEGKLPEGM